MSSTWPSAHFAATHQSDPSVCRICSAGIGDGVSAAASCSSGAVIGFEQQPLWFVPACHRACSANKTTSAAMVQRPRPPRLKEGGNETRRLSNANVPLFVAAYVTPGPVSPSATKRSGARCSSGGTRCGVQVAYGGRPTQERKIIMPALRRGDDRRGHYCSTRSRAGARGLRVHKLPVRHQRAAISDARARNAGLKLTASAAAGDRSARGSARIAGSDRARPLLRAR
jgi:hypothetical protein